MKANQTEKLCGRIFWDVEGEEPSEELKENFTLLPFDSGTERSWKIINSRISMMGDPERMKKMLRFEEDAILISSDNGHLELADYAGIAVLGLEKDIRLFTDYVAADVSCLDSDYIEGVYRRYHSLPWEIAQTEHLLIRETSEEDLTELLRIYQDEELLRFLPAMEDYESEYQKLLAYQKNIYGLLEFGIWTILLKENNAVIGRVGFELKENEGEVLPDLGYAIAADYRRKGYAREACLAAIDWMKEHTAYRQISCRISEENNASIALAKSLSFQKTGGEEVYLLSL